MKKNEIHPQLKNKTAGEKWNKMARQTSAIADSKKFARKEDK